MKKEKTNLLTDTLLLRYYDIAHNTNEEIRPKLGDKINIFFYQARGIPSISNKESAKMILKNGESVGKTLGDAYCHYAPLCPDTSENLGELRNAKTKKDLDKNLIIKEFAGFMKNSYFGILEIHSFGKGKLVLRIQECGECFGLPIFDKSICHFSLGLFSEFFGKLFNKKIKSYESKCVAKGDDFCEFVLKMS